MDIGLDHFDLKILNTLQHDATQSMDSVAQQVNLSRNACWRRIKHLEAAGFIKGRVVLIDPGAVGLDLKVFVMIKAGAHDAQWLADFRRAIETLPQVMGAHRMSGDLDYILRLQVADVADYDRFYQRLTRMVPLGDVSASFVMEDIKDTTALPLQDQTIS